jgi:hypothetical protein
MIYMIEVSYHYIETTCLGWVGCTNANRPLVGVRIALDR